MAVHETETPTYGRDTRAAFTGLIVGAIVLLVLVLTIVKLTNAKYAGHGAAAESTR